MSLRGDRGMEVQNLSTIKKLEEEVRYMLHDEGMEPLGILELIDDVQRLGLGYHFRESTKCALDRIIRSEKVKEKMEDNMYICALYFTLLRQHGYKISVDIFQNFKDYEGNFKGSLAQDIPGMLRLYEASHVAYNGENILDEAREYITIKLKEISEIKIGSQVKHALEFPSYRRMQRLEARWNIEAYNKEDGANQYLLELAILDFNMVQSMLQRDLQQVSCWWKDVDLANKLRFARDRLVESFFWSVGMVFEPEFSECRKGLTKVGKLITVIDDLYDVYGSLEELELFTDAVERWDINALQHLPDYMKICFLALYNTVNSISYDILQEKNQVIIPDLAKVSRRGGGNRCIGVFVEEKWWRWVASSHGQATTLDVLRWADLCKLFLQEAKWSYDKHIPTFNEYMSTAWISSSGPLLLVHAYFLMSQNITTEAKECLDSYPAILRFPSTIFRLCNDSSSSKAEIERGESANAISCFMHENGVSEEVARGYINSLIDENWKMLNKELVLGSPFEKSFIEVTINLARVAQCHYQFGNAHSDPNDVSRNQILSIIIEPVKFLGKTKPM
ncbi:probable terpene synthase 12 [Olea europaea subsp. europaea]|nr:probable terpene synthase 12 [Olea europaea subsp. europaea]